MKATSIHLKACDIGSAEAHNKREKELDYIRKDLSELNESFSYIDKPLPAIEADIRREVKAKTGRKLQKNAIPIKEGVIVIDENTTLKDLQNFCEECRTKFGMIPLSIYIHRDEGYMNSKDWKRNLHAHIQWRMYDENGRNVRLSKQDMSDMQTMAAQHLHMARGKSSDRRHLSAIQYKVRAEEERLNALESDLNRAESDLKAVIGKYTAEVENFYEEAGELGLSCREANQLRKDGTLRVSGVMLPDGTTIQKNDPKNPDITLHYGNYAPDDKGNKTRKGIYINLHWHRDWKSVKTWITEALRSAWYIVNGIPNNRRNRQRMGV